MYWMSGQEHAYRMIDYGLAILSVNVVMLGAFVMYSDDQLTIVNIKINLEFPLCFKHTHEYVLTLYWYFTDLSYTNAPFWLFPGKDSYFKDQDGEVWGENKSAKSDDPDEWLWGHLQCSQRLAQDRNPSCCTPAFETTLNGYASEFDDAFGVAPSEDI